VGICNPRLKTLWFCGLQIRSFLVRDFKSGLTISGFLYMRKYFLQSLLSINGVIFMFDLQQTSPAKAIPVVLCNIIFFLIRKCEAAALALQNTAYFTFKWCAAAGTGFMFMVCHVIFLMRAAGAAHLYLC